MQMKKGLLAVGLMVGLGLFSSNAHAMTLNTGPAYAAGGGLRAALRIIRAMW